MRRLFQTIAEGEYPPVYLDALLRDVRVQGTGARYRPGTANVGGVMYGHSLETEVVNGAMARDREATLTVSLAGRFDRFRATVGRDDNDHILGPGYCFFEVWGDGKLLFKSDAVRSSVTPVKVSTAIPKRSTPQEVDISVRGVRYLRLVTRYATEFTQQARYVQRAMGCVWGGPRLLPLSDAAAGADAVRADPGLRAAVRSAALQVLAALPPRAEDAAAPKLGLTPLRIAGLDRDERFPAGLSEPAVRALLADELFAVQNAAGPKALPLDRNAAARLAADLPADGKQRTDRARVADAGKRAGADLLLLGALALSPKGEWQVSLQLTDAASGKPLGRATRTLREAPPAL
jgi:hypothetical protein